MAVEVPTPVEARKQTILVAVRSAEAERPKLDLALGELEVDAPVFIHHVDYDPGVRGDRKDNEWSFGNSVMEAARRGGGVRVVGIGEGPASLAVSALRSNPGVIDEVITAGLDTEMITNDALPLPLRSRVRSIGELTAAPGVDLRIAGVRKALKRSIPRSVAALPKASAA